MKSAPPTAAPSRPEWLRLRLCLARNRRLSCVVALVYLRLRSPREHQQPNHCNPNRRSSLRSPAAQQLNSSCTTSQMPVNDTFFPRQIRSTHTPCSLRGMRVWRIRANEIFYKTLAGRNRKPPRTLISTPSAAPQSPRRLPMNLSVRTVTASGAGAYCLRV